VVLGTTAETGSSGLVSTQRGVAAAVRSRPWIALGLAFVVLVGAGLRLTGSNWDGTAHVHPDERYISSLADVISAPHGIRNYFDVHASPLSPYLTEAGKGYVYGTLPLFGTKLVASAVGSDDYGALNVVGRRVGALLDAGTIVLVFFVALLLLEPLREPLRARGALLATALYAVTVTAIQHAHYFTVDVWLVFFGTATILLAMLAVRSGVSPDDGRRWPLVVLLGVSLGLTVACKVSGALVALPVAVAFLGRGGIVARGTGIRRCAVWLTAEIGIAALAAYVAFRATNPYAFASSNWLDVSLNHDFRDALRNQSEAGSGAFLYPPSYQWLLAPRVWSPLENLVLWQLGIPLGLAALAGLAVLVVRVGKAVVEVARRRLADDATIVAATWEAMVASFAIVVFVYFASRFAHTGRYLLPIAPFLAVSAAFGVAVLAVGRPRLAAVLGCVVLCASTLWAIAFVQIYRATETRIAASEWIEQHVTPGAAIANEHWDYPLPIAGAWIDPATPKKDWPPNGYRGILVPVFDEDNAKKLQTLYDDLSAADYYVLSSPRAWRTIGRLPDRFPLMSRFYEKLFEGRLGFDEVASFRNEPRLLGVHVDDGRAEEAFWVYDHAPVHIFRREGKLTWPAFKAALCGDPAPSYCA
jgi:hypothetical protein